MTQQTKIDPVSDGAPDTALAPHRPIIGCDVGKAEIVVCDSRTGHCRTLANQATSLVAFCAHLPEDALLICEATGGYEAALLQAAVQAGRRIHRADAAKVKAFIRSLGRLGKTDRLDAQHLARYGLEREHSLAPWRPRAKTLDQLAALVRLRDSLVRTRAGFRCQAKAPKAQALTPHLMPLIQDLSQRIQALENSIAQIIARCDTLAQTAQVIQAIPGCGAITAYGLIALMPELGTLNRRQAASLAGCAPHPRQSGKTEKYRATRGGRQEVKRLLFTAALAASRHNPQLKTTYQRLIQNGKKPKLALTALMRKLITIINARIRDAGIKQLS